MTSDFLRSLIGLCTAQFGVVVKSGDFYEPLAAVYPKTSLPLAEACLANGELAMQHFVARCIAAGLLSEHLLSQTDAPLFFNANTPADFAG